LTAPYLPHLTLVTLKLYIVCSARHDLAKPNKVADLRPVHSIALPFDLPAQMPKCVYTVYTSSLRQTRTAFQLLPLSEGIVNNKKSRCFDDALHICGWTNFLLSLFVDLPYCAYIHSL
jgi:hypothetical protein